MKKTVYYLLFLSVCAFSQTKAKLINPKGKWYFGAEIGLNAITSFDYNEGNTSISIGGISEYYFDKHWSVQARIKYMKTGVSFINQPENSWNFGWIKTTQGVSDSPVYNRFDGQAFVIPIDLKWEFRIKKNWHGSIKTGPSLTMETKSDYAYANVDYSTFAKTFVTMNFGYGLNYYITKKYCLGLDFEYYFLGDSKGSTYGFLWNKAHYATNSLYNIQLKYSL
ncbi:MAG: outer membrane beta-barrel protein [Flavobacterium sp.]